VEVVCNLFPGHGGGSFRKKKPNQSRPTNKKRRPAKAPEQSNRGPKKAGHTGFRVRAKKGRLGKVSLIYKFGRRGRKEVVKRGSKRTNCCTVGD